MKRLSLRQAVRCENAEHGRCRCRCHGAAHGIARQGNLVIGRGPEGERTREFFANLPLTDPHHIPLPPPKKGRRKPVDAQAE